MLNLLNSVVLIGIDYSTNICKKIKNNLAGKKYGFRLCYIFNIIINNIQKADTDWDCNIN